MKINNASIEYVDDLNYMNYLEKAKIIIKSVNTILAVASISVRELCSLSGLHRLTVNRILFENKEGHFKSYSKLNQFVKSVLDVDSDKKFIIDDLSYSDEEIN